MYVGLKIHKIISKISVKNFEKILFSTQNFRKIPILGQKFDKSSEPEELDRSRDACNMMHVRANNDRNTILLKLAKNIFKISPTKIKKLAKKLKVLEKNFFGQNRFRMVQNLF